MLRDMLLVGDGYLVGRGWKGFALSSVRRRGMAIECGRFSFLLRYHLECCPWIRMGGRGRELIIFKLMLLGTSWEAVLLMK